MCRQWGNHGLVPVKSAAAVELGLHQATLQQVERAVGRDQSVAQQVAEGFGEPAVSDALVVRHEQFPDQIGVVDEVHEGGFHRHGDQVAATGRFLDQSQRVGQVAEGLADDRQLGRAWRQRFPVNLGTGRTLNGGGRRSHGESSCRAVHRKTGRHRLCPLRVVSGNAFAVGQGRRRTRCRTAGVRDGKLGTATDLMTLGIVQFV